MKVCYDFYVLAFFLVYEIIWLFVAFVELLGLVGVFFFVYKIIWLFVLSCRTLCEIPVMGMK
jgi:hypothetical protein